MTGMPCRRLLVNRKTKDDEAANDSHTIPVFDDLDRM